MNISIIGSGNVATQLGKAFQKAGHTIIQVISRNEKTGKELATKLKCIYSATYNGLKKNDNTIFLIAVKDAQIAEVANALNKTNSFVMHTSGSVGIEVLKTKFKNCGVFYPLQTIKKNRSINIKNVPVCVEASNLKTEQTLLQLAQSITTNIYFLNSEQRLYIHLAAVFANNFTNHLYLLAEQILKQNHLPFDLLKPLIEQTAKNVSAASPFEMQTGPAMRNDKITIEKHLKLLTNEKELHQLYKLLTDSIYKSHKKQ